MILILKTKGKHYLGNLIIQSLLKVLKKKKKEARAENFEDIEVFMEKGNVKVLINGINLIKYKTVFFRKIGRNKNLAYIIATLAKKHKISYFDKIYNNTINTGKLAQDFILALNNVSIPKTYFSLNYTPKQVKRAVKYLKLPVVIKYTKSSHSKGVFLAKTEKQLLNKLKRMKLKEEVILQEFIVNDFDYRIFILGKFISNVKKKKRTRKNEFRNDVRLGAKETRIKNSSVPKRVKNEAIKAASAYNVQIAGIDVIIDSKGKAYIIEINRSPLFNPNTRVTNQTTKLANFILRQESHKK